MFIKINLFLEQKSDFITINKATTEYWSFLFYLQSNSFENEMKSVWVESSCYATLQCVMSFLCHFFMLRYLRQFVYDLPCLHISEQQVLFLKPSILKPFSCISINLCAL